MSTGHPIITLTALRELWIHTGTACNLSCPFCHEGSQPGDTRLQAPTLAELAPLFDAAVRLGVERFAFTGGEPLILKGVHEILLQALARRPVLVLTNGTAPFIRRSHQLQPLREAPHALSFRVSIDYPDEARHDAGRGLKNFRKAIEGLRLLHQAGFATGITRQGDPGEDAALVDARFRALLRRQRLPEDLPIVALPELGRPGTPPPTIAPPAASGVNLQTACARSRMVLRRDGRLRIHACPLTDDDPAFDLGGSLPAAMKTGVVANHARCTVCLGPGVNYAGPSPPR